MMQSITFEEIDKHWNYGERITKKAIIDVISKEAEKDYLIFKLVKDRFNGEMKTRIKQGRVILEIKPIYKPIISEELWQQVKKQLQNQWQKYKRWEAKPTLSVSQTFRNGRKILSYFLLQLALSFFWLSKTVQS